LSIISNTNNPDKPQYWDLKYETNNIGWDISKPTPVFTQFFKKLKDKNKKILIPGSGNGHDAIFLSELGFKVYTVDFSKVANNNLILKSQKKGLSIKVISEDFFNLSNYNQFFDVVLEYTFFCAINPKKRDKYIKKVYSLLKDKGIFVGLFLPINKGTNDTGPPFQVNLDIINKNFSKYFSNIVFEKSNFSIKPRRDNEVFFTMTKC
tara:strand:+ start:179 stop:799 length:621 start_codon:yes stop_codon:yes gene_type:complete